MLKSIEGYYKRFSTIFVECYIVIMVSTGGNSGGGKTLKELMAAATTLQSIAVQSIKVGWIIKRISKNFLQSLLANIENKTNYGVGRNNFLQTISDPVSTYAFFISSSYFNLASCALCKLAILLWLNPHVKIIHSSTSCLGPGPFIQCQLQIGFPLAAKSSY